MYSIKISSKNFSWFKRRLLMFTTSLGRRKKQTYENFEKKKLFWDINNLKEEHLEEKSSNFFKQIENENIDDEISDIVGISRSIPKKHEINEKMGKRLFKNKNIKEEENTKSEIKNIFNPSMKLWNDQKTGESNDTEEMNVRQKCKEYIKKIQNKQNINKDEYNFKIDTEKQENMFDYESMKSQGLYQDLTHDEYSQMYNMYIKKCDMDRKIRWFKMNDILNPMKEAKSIINSLKVSKNESIETHKQEECSDDNDEMILKKDIKPFYENEGQFSHKIKRICEQNQYDEIVSRIRMKIRKEKMENSKIIKEKIPNVARHILDPIKYHVQRRRVRTEKLLHTHLEQLLNCNNAYFKHYLLNGLTISIHHLEMKSPRSLCKIVYSLLDKNRNHESIQEKLDQAAFILRRLLARKLQLGYTPPLKFIPLEEQRQQTIKHLQYYQMYSKYQYPLELKTQSLRSKKMMEFFSKDLGGFKCLT